MSRHDFGGRLRRAEQAAQARGGGAIVVLYEDGDRFSFHDPRLRHCHSADESRPWDDGRSFGSAVEAEAHLAEHGVRLGHLIVVSYVDRRIV